MFAEFNTDKFPLVFVTFSESLNTEEEFDEFLKGWLLLYHNRKDFIFIFDTRIMKNISPKYCIKIALFIRKLKKEPHHYLQKSLIIMNDNRIKRLLDMVFSLQAPVAPVYLWPTEEYNKDIIYEIANSCSRDNLSDNMIYIKPGKTLV
jgi:hypothetical protein|tara:strand:+ start:126 stop:569 length:444 start_codon:yes stop_codon:yes gene_type:complete